MVENSNPNEFPAKLVALIHKVNKDLATLHQYSSDDFLPVNEIFKNYYDRFKNMKVEKAVNPEDRNYEEIIGSIITDLQFHDIIRQKLEHIEAINVILINEFNKKIENKNFFSEYIGVIPEIVKVNKAQLNLINEEYQSTICKLRVNLEYMEGYIARVSSVSLNFSNSITQSANFNKLYMEIVKTLNEIFSLAPIEEKVTEESRNKVIKSVGAVYTMQSERAVFDKIFETSSNAKVTGAGNAEKDIEFF